MQKPELPEDAAVEAVEVEPGERERGGRIGVLRLSPLSLGIAVVLTLMSAIYSYISGMPLVVDEQLFLLIVFYVIVHLIRWLWSRSAGAKGR